VGAFSDTLVLSPYKSTDPITLTTIFFDAYRQVYDLPMLISGTPATAKGIQSVEETFVKVFVQVFTSDPSASGQTSITVGKRSNGPSVW
jgi:hypothetical protein